MAKRWIVRLALAATMAAAIVGLSTAPVGATCPSPGTGYAGSYNMLAGGGGMAQAESVFAPQGMDGMMNSVQQSAC